MSLRVPAPQALVVFGASGDLAKKKIRIQPDEGISLAFQAKVPGPGFERQTVRMDFDYEDSFKHEPAEAY